jgi:hypothetical protein
MLKSGRQIVGPESLQTPVVWWLVESGDEVVGVISDACKVARTGMADFFFGFRYFKVFSDDTVRHVPWSI